jgi:hypothetical protein
MTSISWTGENRFFGWLACTVFLTAFFFHTALGQDNSQVNVIVTGVLSSTLTITPNPSKPIFSHEVPGRFNVRNNLNARDWVRNDQAGVVFTFNFISYTADITADITIFDSFGAKVAAASGILGGYLPDSNYVNADIYWNGSFSNGDIAHEGAYTAELQYRSSIQDAPTKIKGSFYLTKPDFGHSTCGGNYSMAFLPALLLKTRKPLLHFIKNILKKPNQPC